MSKVDNDGVYRSQRRRVQRRKKVLVAVVGLAAMLGGGAYGVTAWRTARDITDPNAYAPAVTPPSDSALAPGPDATAEADAVSPTPHPSRPRLAGVPQSSRPSPTPSASAEPDDQVAAAQVSHLLQVPRVSPSGGTTGITGAITVTNEAAPDGSVVRVIAARYDLTARGTSLWAADSGHAINGAHCTQNLLVDKTPQVRPSMMLCWRTSPTRSVITVATSTKGRPAASVSADVLDRTWRGLG